MREFCFGVSCAEGWTHPALRMNHFWVNDESEHPTNDPWVTLILTLQLFTTGVREFECGAALSGSRLKGNTKTG
jgi:hypothetical protein